jgi:hypothetical protein
VNGHENVTGTATTVSLKTVTRESLDQAERTSQSGDSAELLSRLWKVPAHRAAVQCPELSAGRTLLVDHEP